LIDALSGHHLWSERYDRDLKEIFAMQDEVTLKILTAMQVNLTEIAGAETGDKYFKGKQGLECYLKVMEGVHYIQSLSIEGGNKARRIGEEIVARWPENPYGYLILGWAHYLDLTLGSTKSHQESFEKAMEMAKKTLNINDSNSNAHGLLSFLYTYKGDHEKGIAESERAVALDPNGAMAYHFYAMSLLGAGRAQEAIPMFQKAIRLNPYSQTSYFTFLGTAYSNTGQFEEAVSTFKKALLREPNNLFAHLLLANTYIRMGREKEARIEAAEVLRINPKFSLDNHAKAMTGAADKSVVERYIGRLRKAGLK